MEDKIYKDGLECFPKSNIIFENICFLLNWGIGYYLLLPFEILGIPIISLIYLIVLIIMQILLKKHNCTNCYYYDKWCHLGWGKLTSKFFSKNSGDADIGMKLTFFYILQLPVILILSIIGGYIFGFSQNYIVMIIIFVIINIFQAAVLRKKGCKKCKARFYCKGSAASK